MPSTPALAPVSTLIPAPTPAPSQPAPIAAPTPATASHRAVYFLPEVSAGRVSNVLSGLKRGSELTGKENFAAWDQSIMMGITQLGLVGHIRDEADMTEVELANATVRNRPIVAPPEPGPVSSEEEIAEWGRYTANEMAIIQVLHYRMADSVRIGLPGADDRGSCCTAKELYLATKQQFGLGNLTVQTTTKNRLFATRANSMAAVTAYAKNYNNVALALARTDPQLNWSEVLQNYGRGLPPDPNITTARDDIIHNLSKDRKCSKKTWDVALEKVNDRVATWTPTTPSSPGGASAGGTNDSRHRRGGKERKKCENTDCNYWGTFEKFCSRHTPETPMNANTPSMNTNTNTTRSNTLPSKNTVAAVVGGANTITDSTYIACTLPEPQPSSGNSTIEQLRRDKPAVLHRLVQQYTIVLDSAATRHVIKDKRLFEEFDPMSEERVTTGVAGDVVVKGGGTCLLQVLLKETDMSLRLWLSNCLYSPEASFNLISGGVLIERGYSIVLNENDCRVLLPSRFSNTDRRLTWHIDFRHCLIFPTGSFISTDPWS
ncbi:hypothetical protein V5O48_015904 [Marasmius crinis-equi]|uniref:Retrovirus-related Pol polyprotein from transposon TNT 1-94-like beta-barrel domain-containing protein n=1 Tax=Marasmius crinis-equi TaxID=585013 RepID=A0ABR3ET74_9AGAR